MTTTHRTDDALTTFRPGVDAPVAAKEMAALELELALMTADRDGVKDINGRHRSEIERLKTELKIQDDANELLTRRVGDDKLMLEDQGVRLAIACTELVSLRQDRDRLNAFLQMQQTEFHALPFWNDGAWCIARPIDATGPAGAGVVYDRYESFTEAIDAARAKAMSDNPIPFMSREDFARGNFKGDALFPIPDYDICKRIWETSPLVAEICKTIATDAEKKTT